MRGWLISSLVHSVYSLIAKVTLSLTYTTSSKTLTRKVKQVPGVDDVAVTSWIAQHGNYRQAFLLTHDADSKPKFDYAYSESVSRDYFDAYELAPIKGEIFDDEFEGAHND